MNQIKQNEITGCIEIVLIQISWLLKNELSFEKLIVLNDFSIQICDTMTIGIWLYYRTFWLL